MTQDNKVVMQSTTTHGYLYRVYHKDDLDQKKILYTGEISDDPKYCWCECDAFIHGKPCYHQAFAKNIMEVKI